jgi:hypothetical protein
MVLTVGVEFKSRFNPILVAHWDGESGGSLSDEPDRRFQALGLLRVEFSKE